MGKPCVSYDLDGAPEVVIPGETGYLVRPGDAAGLADAVTRLLADQGCGRAWGRPAAREPGVSGGDHGGPNRGSPRAAAHRKQELLVGFDGRRADEATGKDLKGASL